MKKKIFLLLISLLLTGCSFFNDKQEYVSEFSDEVTTLDIFGGVTVEFNMLKDSHYLDTGFDFNAGEIDTTYMYFDNPETANPEEFSDDDVANCIFFQVSVYDPAKNESFVEKVLKNSYNITNPIIEKIDDDIFEYHIQGESETYYIDSYYMIYDNVAHGGTAYYEITLQVEKGKVTKEELNRAKEEYKAIIDTLKFK